jgi:hypothetical protein
MRPPPAAFLRSLSVLTAALALGPGAAALDSLLRNSPFMPLAAPVVEAPPSNQLDRYELRGVSSLGGTAMFSVFDNATGRSFWLRQGDTVEGISVQHYDPGSEAVTLAGSGQTKRLQLKEAQIVTMATPPPQPTMQVPPSMPQPGGAGGVVAGGARAQPSEQEINERRQAIVEELRRRRALRQQALQSGQPAPQ